VAVEEAVEAVVAVAVEVVVAAAVAEEGGVAVVSQHFRAAINTAEPSRRQAT
jgi:hypothetical protein